MPARNIPVILDKHAKNRAHEMRWRCFVPPNAPKQACLNLWKEECKKQAVCSRIFEFGRSIFGHFGYPRGSFSVILEAPGAHFGGLGAHLDPLGSNLRILIKNDSNTDFADPPQGVPKSTKNPPNLAKGRLGGSKVSSGTSNNGCSDFGSFFGAALGGPMCSKHSK